LLSEQAYRVAHWRVASEEINYRRFRDINDLAGLRVEEQRVFDAVHEVIFDLVREGSITALRIDAIDGLLDPSSYLHAVQHQCRPRGHPEHEKSIFLVVEKVLTEGELLPESWPVHGTTGYDFLNQLCGVFIDQQGSHAMLEHYVRLTHRRQLFPEVAWECKKLVLGRVMNSQLAMLGRRLFHIAEQQRGSRDFSAQDLSGALVEVLACQRVYRTYLGPDGQLSESDVKRVDEAVAEARRRNPAMSSLLFDFVRSVMVLELAPELTEVQREERRAFVLRLQQLSAGMMSRALENIAANRFYPLSSSGEVGTDPEYPALQLGAFHRRNQERLQRIPHSMLTTSTHDTKRSEDVRARVRVLSRFPESWAAAFEKFHVMNQRHCEALPEGHAPDVNEEYLFYQTLVGVWPFEPLDKERRAELSDRLSDYMVRVVREAKVHSSSVSPHEPWENAVRHFVESVLLPATSGDFLPAFQSFVEPLMKLGVWTSLGEVLIKTTAPGVPDFYQGNELWDLSLMEPDNRRPVDFVLRERLLRDLLFEAEQNPVGLIKKLVLAPGDGRLKMFVTQRSLVARRSQHVVFERGAYLPLEVMGQQADRVISFARSHENKTFVVACGRFLSAVKAHERTPIGEQVWGATRLWLPPGHETTLFRDAFTGLQWEAEGGSLRMCDVFAHLPLALLESVDEV
jgi:(1->4)-alpha-D-glucan 1-alpha-D-glucosylmutase